MRDLIDDPHPDFTASMMADLTAKPAKEPAGGDFGGKATQVHAGSAEGIQRAPQRVRRREPWTPAMDAEQAGHFLDSAAAFLENLYTAALRAMGPDPIPLTASEPWEESDEAYRKRLQAPAWLGNVELDPDAVGVFLGLPRPRLVPTQQEPRP